MPGGVRHGPLVAAMQPELQWTLEAELGRPPAELPPSLDLETPFGSLRLDFSAEDNGYRVEGRLRFVGGLVAADEVAALRDFLVTVERHLGRRLESP